MPTASVFFIITIRFYLFNPCHPCSPFYTNQAFVAAFPALISFTPGWNFLRNTFVPVKKNL